MRQSPFLKVKILGNSDWEPTFVRLNNPATNTQTVKLLIWANPPRPLDDIRISSNGVDWPFTAADIQSDTIGGLGHRRLIIKTQPPTGMAIAPFDTVEQTMTVTITNTAMGGINSASDTLVIQVVDESFFLYFRNILDGTTHGEPPLKFEIEDGGGEDPCDE